ncbi:MAG: hypothetical protein IJE70_05210 [Oscillospiraceae bacterium]|nr:hypothetical protein [Oscillospiraceae bacterium]
MKKALSLILAIIMVVAMIPAGAMAADATAESYTYNFKKGLHGTTTHLQQCLEWESTDADEGEWIWERYLLSGGYANGTNLGTTLKDGTYWYNYRPKVTNPGAKPVYSPGINLASDEFLIYLTLKIEVKQSGTYIPSLSLITENSSPMWDVYLTKADTSVSELNNSQYINWINALDSSDRLGMIDGYGTGDYVTETFLNRKLEKGSYYLVFIANGKNPSCTFDLESTIYRIEIILKNFILKNVNAKPESYTYNMTSSALKDPSTASTYCDEKTADLGLAITNFANLTYDVVSDTENKFAYGASIYARNGEITEQGISFYLYPDRYLYIGSYFKDSDGDGIKDAPDVDGSTSSYLSSSNVALKVQVPTQGKYKLYLYNKVADEYGCLANVYFADSRTNDIMDDRTSEYFLENRFDSAVAHPEGVYIGDVEVTKDNGEYYLIFTADSRKQTNTNKITVATGRDWQTVNLSGIRLEPITEEPSPEIVEAQNKFNEIETAKKAEIATAKNEGLSETAFVNVLNTSIDGSFSELEGKIVATRGEDVTVKADSWSGYDFLYWRQGLGADAKVIASSTECTVKAAPGTWLTAVYKPASSTDVSVLFYNADGEIIDSDLVAKDETITFPSAPTAPKGCGEFLGWALNTPDNIVTEATAGGKSMVFVAQFAASTEKNIAVTVNGGATGGGSYAYGETVTVTATEREGGSGSNVFVYWKKGDEIVSFDKTYSFLAWETCTLTPVYAAYKPVTDALRKIIVSGDGTDLMAEFIGIGNVKEKGILFDKNKSEDVTFANATHKIAMTSDGNFLSAINDIANGATYTGYAILSDNTVVYDK